MVKAALKKEQKAELLGALEKRFWKNPGRHPDLDWELVLARLEAMPGALRSLLEMERTGGEPDVIGVDPTTGEVLFCDCSAQTPKLRRSCCYDRAGFEKRLKEGLEPNSNVIDMAAEMGVEILTEEQYLHLQTLGEFDTSTQSWLKTPEGVAALGGSIFGEHRYGRVFVGPNTPPCFYRGRGFRGLLRV